ncbi:hypothetical protein D3C71_344260 [compost metagenome]|jgi:hypothetical protein
MGMTLGDFFLLSFYDLMLLVESHNNNKKEQWYHTRFIAYANYCASWANPKKRPKSINQYMPIDEDGETIIDYDIKRMLENFEIAREEYKQKVLAKKQLVN